MNRKTLVGMLLLGALIIFGLGTFYIENWQFYLREGYQLNARFPMVHGLDKGDLVRMSGVTVGKVAEISIDTDSLTELPVQAVLWIERDVKVKSDDEAQVRAASLFGGNFVAIVRGDPSASALLPGEQIMKTSVTPSMPDIIRDSGATLSEVRGAFRRIREIGEKVEKGEGVLSRWLFDQESYQDVEGTLKGVREAFASVRETADQFREGEGPLPRLLTDKEMALDLEKASADARHFIEDLKAISKDVRAGKGAAGKFFSDDALYDDLRSAATEGREAFASLKDLITEAREGEGFLARALSDRELADEMEQMFSDGSAAFAQLKEASGDLREFASALAEGEGTLGEVVRDRALYDRITRTLENLERIIEDYREQSPVITFFGAFFSAF